MPRHCPYTSTSTEVLSSVSSPEGEAPDVQLFCVSELLEKEVTVSVLLTAVS